MRSMTGFGRARGGTDRVEMSVALRTVNHKNLDLAIRLPQAHRDQEDGIRKQLKKSFARGRVDCQVEIVPAPEHASGVMLDRAAVQRILQLSQELVDGDESPHLRKTSLSLAELLGLPGVLRESASSAEELFGRDEEVALLGVLDEAIEAVIAARGSEGEHLAAVFQKGLATLQGSVEQLTEQRESFRDQVLPRLRARIEELLEGAGDKVVDPGRLEQEAAFLVDKSDVKEELDRLLGHIEAFRTALQQPGAVGRRLDFLSQEMLRECNTLGAKSRDLSMQRLVLDAKLACDQLREQIQNVE